ncbi:MAG: V-type ATP synthase subunit D [candidate division WOR-3 bacterium]|nr:V-type ATP synthase subunit D [candidate division WOR-3 bacterium]MDW8114282.1 V-type ATP synthase subunit D [candidate division WOR-3 bacterium]
MLIPLNATRQELLRLKKREIIAVRGHKLLKDRQEQLLRILLSYIEEIKKLRKEVYEETKEVLKYLSSSFLLEKEIFYENIFINQNYELSIKESIIPLLNIKTTLYDFSILEKEKLFPFYQTSSLFDIALEKLNSLIKKLGRLSALLKIVAILSYEIEKTRRRVNALEYHLIPKIRSAIRYISFRLSEYERENLIRIMRIRK